MAKDSSMKFEASGKQFDAKPTDAELHEHIEAVNGSVPHVAITFQHLTPNRTRVIAEKQWDPDIEEMSRLVANADAIESARIEAARRGGLGPTE